MLILCKVFSFPVIDLHVGLIYKYMHSYMKLHIQADGCMAQTHDMHVYNDSFIHMYARAYLYLPYTFAHTLSFLRHA